MIVNMSEKRPSRKLTTSLSASVEAGYQPHAHARYLSAPS